MLQTRAAIIRQVRSFFYERNYLELDTPLLSQDLIPESCLDVFKTQRLFPRGSKKESYPLWLIPSPEIWMKKIIARHGVNIFQICKCFRNGESEGRLHNFEFTMLEYYTMEADYMDSLALTEELFGFLEKNLPRRHRGAHKNLSPPFERVTAAQAFERHAGFDLFAAAEKEGAMEEQARRLGLDPPPGMTTAQLYDLIFIHAVEPELKSKSPIALLDYPAFVPCLAKKSHNGKTAERWELYYDGIELANCFSEETDPQKVKEFFLSEEAARERAFLEKHNVDHDYQKIFENFPRSSGAAMGIDRLIMALCGISDIDAVLIK